MDQLVQFFADFITEENKMVLINNHDLHYQFL